MTSVLLLLEFVLASDFGDWEPWALWVPNQVLKLTGSNTLAMQVQLWWRMHVWCLIHCAGGLGRNTSLWRRWHSCHKQ